MEQIKILIVEDEKNIARTIDATFSNMGYAIELCYDGETALQKLQAAPWNIVFLDIKLPGIDGMEVLRQIYEDKIPVQVVMITAYGSVDFAVQAMKYGAVDFIQKPFEPENLRDIVRRIADRKALLEHEQNSYHDLFELAKQQITARDYQKARALLDKAILQKPESLEAYNLLGAVCEMLQDYMSAVKAYQMALKLDKDFRPAIENIRRITAMDDLSTKLGELEEIIKRH